MQIVALDVHISSITAAMLDLQAPEPKTVVRRFGTDPGGIRELSKRLQRDDVVLLEAATNAFWLHDQLAGRKVCCPRGSRGSSLSISLRKNGAPRVRATRACRVLRSFPILMVSLWSSTRCTEHR